MAQLTVTPEYEAEAEEFYKSFLYLMEGSRIPFLLAGTYALKHYADIDRPTKDFDIFCKAGDYPKILKKCIKAGYEVEILDERWLAKVKSGEYYVDIIFGSHTGHWPITDAWFAKAKTVEVLGFKVRVTSPEELIVSKSYRMKRNRFDGADVVHLILKVGTKLDWKRLLNRMDATWEVLFAHVILFRFIYPSERENVPLWVLKEFIARVNAQLVLPTPLDKISRGAMLSTSDFQVDFEKWGFLGVANYTDKSKA